MDIIKPRTLSGFMELLPSKQIQFERMVSILRDTYASYGFAPLDTPAIEDAQILTPEEQKGARKTLKAAAMTYVAAMSVALAQLLRLILIYGRRRRRD